MAIESELEQGGSKGSDIRSEGEPAACSHVAPKPLAPRGIHTKLFIGIWEQAGVSWEAGESWEAGAWGASWEAGESWGVSWSKLGGWRELGASWEAGESWGKGSELEQAGWLERAGSKLEQGQQAGRLERAGSKLERAGSELEWVREQAGRLERAGSKGSELGGRGSPASALLPPCP